MSEKKLLKFNDFKHCIDYYKKYRKNEYDMKFGIQTPHNALLEAQGLTLETRKFDEKNSVVVVKKEAVERFHPNNIDNKEFWTYAKKVFPKFSVCGGKSKTIKECNLNNLGLPKAYGFFEKLVWLMNANREKLNFFEIGFGHGNVFNEIKDQVNYLGIDYYKMKKLNKYKELMIIDKSGIPDSIVDGSQDIIYCVNVLQHCSQHDRFEYLEQAYKKLKSGGYFFGSCFVHCKENTHLNIWGMIDVDGRRYCNFFNQLTEVDDFPEIAQKIDKIGYKVERWGIVAGNHFHFILKKD